MNPDQINRLIIQTIPDDVAPSIEALQVMMQGPFAVEVKVRVDGQWFQRVFTLFALDEIL